MMLAKEEYNGITIGFSGFDGGEMKQSADACVVVPFDSTPQVESFHLAFEHLICSCLKEKIKTYFQEQNRRIYPEPSQRIAFEEIKETVLSK